ncbi:MAG: TonB-dependent receptor [Bacteroidaceae bacterium]|nr:TonB-dependent receptor [Bacteroidaceae bacterium]
MRILLKHLLLQAALLLTTVAAYAQKEIKGRVVDAITGDPLIGASVTVKNDTQGAATDLDGKFSLSVQKNFPLTLHFDYVGYRDLDVEVYDNAESVEVRLEEISHFTDEVVVIGYGTQRRGDISTAISSVNGDQIVSLPTSTLTQALAGLSSGISLQQVSGAPGTAPAIRIRGAGSINSGNDPLYVIDGYPTTDSELFNSLNQNDIENIQILKDAASSAIYGSKAGNGVIIVTTKQGRLGKPRVQLSTQFGISQVERYVDVLNASEFLDMVIEARTNNGTIGNYPDLIKLRDSGNYPDTDWQKAIFRNASNFRVNASVSGGTEVVKYNFSANYQDEDGILLNSFYKRVNLKGGFEARLSNYVKIGASFSSSYTSRRSQQPSGGNTENVSGIIAEALTYAPILPVYQPNGDYTQVAQHYSGKDGQPDYGLNNKIYNPVSNLLENNDDTKGFRTLTSAYLQVEPLEGLSVRSTVNLTTNSSRHDYYQSAYLLGSNLIGNKSTPDLNSIDAYRIAGYGYNIYWSTTANYNFQIDGKHHFNVVAGYDLEHNSGFSVRQDDRTDSSNPVAYSNTNITNVNGATLWTGSSSNSEYSFDAIFSRLIYDYDGRYNLSASIRRDRSSKFGPDKRAGWFYSVSGAWNAKQERFLKDVEWLNALKVRASYGVTGNDQIGNNYAWISSLASNHQVVFGTTTLPSYYPAGYSNTQLGWEKNRQADLGLDFEVLKRVTLTFDWYQRRSDVVMKAAIPNFNGISGSINMNAGEVENKGAEISLGVKIIDSKDWKWHTQINWSKNNNKILSLADNQKQLSSEKAGTKWANVIRNYVGRPMGDMYMLKVIGTFNTEEDLNTYAKNGSQGIGDLIFEDVNDDGVINTDDYQLVGNYQPDFTYGWSNNVQYKNIDLSLTIDGQVGGNVINAAARAYTLNRWDDNVLAESGLNRWRSADNPGNGLSHVAGTNNLGTNIGPSTRYLYSASFLRIRSLSLGYTLPRKWSGFIGINSLRASVNVQNLWTFDNYSGYSVEANYKGNSATNNGVDFGSYPPSRVITFGLNLNF